jgi:FlaA1/EpsC-like NDP-sugar epimerase
MKVTVRYWRKGFMWTMLGTVAALSLLAAFLLRFEFQIPDEELRHLSGGLLIALAAKLVVFHLFRCDRGGWRYTGLADISTLVMANVIGSVVFVVGAYATFGVSFPRSVYCIDLLICFLGTTGVRLGARIYHEQSKQANGSGKPARGVLIYGAGSAGISLLREVRSNGALGWQVLGFIDDDVRKAGLTIMGVSVLGSGREAAAVVERLRSKKIVVNEIVIAMPSVTGSKLHEAVANCRATGVPCKTIPGVASLLTGKVLISQIRDISTEELLGRKPVRLDEEVIRGSLEGRSVMVTGGGGSIGSELCRQVASFQPGKLIIFERAESDLFRIHTELIDRYPNIDIVPVIGDIQNYGNVEQAIRSHDVNAIFHAAAYKHVPMMERHVVEAVKNNVLGTRNVVHAAAHNDVENFLMISSDKAVNPTNVMGLTKRVAELLASAMPSSQEASRTKYVSVRFGNVLGSNGSVVPLFREQIAKGGPVTVTHPDMKRYFMTIAEAVQLVLQASTMGKGSEIFVLDMGEPVPIVNLARDMIRLSGFEPDRDIEIRFTGTRPGEKLFEELILEGEQIAPTYHEKIKIFQGSRMRRAETDEWLKELQTLVNHESEVSILMHLKELVPEYQPDGRWRSVLEPERARSATAS